LWNKYLFNYLKAQENEIKRGKASAKKNFFVLSFSFIPFCSQMAELVVG